MQEQTTKHSGIHYREKGRNGTKIVTDWTNELSIDSTNRLFFGPRCEETRDVYE